MNYEALAFYIGVFASLHCVAMCGPLMLSLPFSNQSIWIAIFQKLLYQSGRILMYCLIGLAIGFVGTGFDLLGLQQALSLITGILLVGAAMRYFFKRKKTSSALSSKLLQALTAHLGKQLSKPYGSFFAGSLNGLLPCGMVYIALAQAINLHTPFESGKFMLFFGVGTTPLLFLTALAPVFFRKFRTPPFLLPALFLIAGSFLISRGLNLEIPYVSHAIVSDHNVCK